MNLMRQLGDPCGKLVKIIKQQIDKLANKQLNFTNAILFPHFLINQIENK